MYNERYPIKLDISLIELENSLIEWEIFNSIKKLSNWIIERCKWNSALSNCTHIENSVIKLESSVIELGN